MYLIEVNGKAIHAQGALPTKETATKLWEETQPDCEQKKQKMVMSEMVVPPTKEVGSDGLWIQVKKFNGTKNTKKRVGV